MCVMRQISVFLQIQHITPLGDSESPHNGRGIPLWRSLLVPGGASCQNSGQLIVEHCLRYITIKSTCKQKF